MKTCFASWPSILSESIDLEVVLGRFDNIHPGLTCDHARHILSLPIDELETNSDFYMAAAHLVNCPCSETEDALQSLLICDLEDQAVKIAKRKAVEVLARLGSESSIPLIGQCLFSEDIYLVENSVWALDQLGCNDQKLIRQMISLLGDNSQNQRVLIQALSRLAIEQSLDSIQSLQDSDRPGVRGAAIAAVSQYTSDKSMLLQITEHLMLPNQMDRQCAVQDLIDGGAIDLLPSIATAPVSPAFRIRACREILAKAKVLPQEQLWLDFIDTILRDDPAKINIIHKYEVLPPPEALIHQLYDTDFSRCYLAMQNLPAYSSESLTPILQKSWEEEAHNDYGAHYFFMHIFGSRDDWSPSALDWVLDLLYQAAINRRPQFQKSRAAAIQAIHRLNPDLFFELGSQLLRGSIHSSWDCRYVTIMCLERSSIASLNLIKELIMDSQKDSDVFLQARAALALTTIAS